MDKSERWTGAAQREVLDESHSAGVVDASELDQSPLDEILRQGARKMLIEAIEAEADGCLTDHAHQCDADGH